VPAMNLPRESVLPGHAGTPKRPWGEVGPENPSDRRLYGGEGATKTLGTGSPYLREICLGVWPGFSRGPDIIYGAEIEINFRMASAR